MAREHRFGGALVQTLNRRPWLIQEYIEDGWPSVLTALLHSRQVDSSAPKFIAQKAMMEAILFWKFDWCIKRVRISRKTPFVCASTGRASLRGLSPSPQRGAPESMSILQRLGLSLPTHLEAVGLL